MAYNQRVNAIPMGSEDSIGSNTILKEFLNSECGVVVAYTADHGREIGLKENCSSVGQVFMRRITKAFYKVVS